MVDSGAAPSDENYGASAAVETDDPDEAYAGWPGEYLPVRLPWPLDTDANLKPG